jgi:tRNA A-37 threonylcarbamoyl transferase component Bud32
MAEAVADGRHFRKTRSDGGALDEAERTRWAREIATATQLFVVPAIVSADERTLIQQRLSGYVPLRSAPRFLANPLPIATRLGQALAAIHATDCHGSPGRHGDLTCENVLHHAETDALAIVDWSDARWYRNGRLDPGPHTDLAIFVLSVFAAGLSQRGLAAPEEIASAFLTGYAIHSRVRVRQDLVRNFEGTLARFVDYDWDLVTKLRLWTFARSYRRAGRFIATMRSI